MGNHNLQRHTHEIISAKPDEDLTAWISRGGMLPSYYWTMLDNLLISQELSTCIYSTPVKILEPLILQAISDCAVACCPEGSADFHDALYFLGLKPRLNFDEDPKPEVPEITVKPFGGPSNPQWYKIWINGQELITEAGDTFCIHEVLDWVDNWHTEEEFSPEERDCCDR